MSVNATAHDRVLEAYKQQLEGLLVRMQHSHPQLIPSTATAQVAALESTFIPSVPLPPGLTWLPQPTLLTWRSSMPMRSTGQTQWYLEYRQPVHPRLCSHNVPSARDGSAHYILRDEKSIHLTGNESIQSARCWASCHLIDPMDMQCNPDELSVSAYTDYGEPTAETLASMLFMFGGSAYGTLQEVTYHTPHTQLCGSSHSADDFTNLGKAHFGWVGISSAGAEFHKCNQCMYGDTGISDVLSADSSISPDLVG